MNHRQRMGKLIQSTREQRGITIEELAEKSGITRQNVIKVENGAYNTPIDVIGRLADAMNARILIESI